MFPDNLAALALMGHLSRAFEDDHLEQGCAKWSSP